MHASAMSHHDSLDVKYIDTKYSSGDSKTMISIQYQEENNNEVDELSKDLSEMGCIVGATKRPSNICVETCIYESDGEKSDHYEEDGYSDEFEEDKSEEEDREEPSKIESKSAMSETSGVQMCAKTPLKLSKSQSTMSSNKPPASVSGRSTSYGSISVPQTRRINMSFTNERLREIERHNHILLTKILSAKNTKSSIPSKEQLTRRPVPSAAVFRKNQQRKIDHDNMILLKKIQRAKSSAYSMRR